MTMKPSVLEMLKIGETCGLHDLNEAYHNYMNHYNLFFSIEGYVQQYQNFLDEIKNVGLLDNEGYLRDISIKEAKNVFTQNNV